MGSTLEEARKVSEAKEAARQEAARIEQEKFDAEWATKTTEERMAYYKEIGLIK